VNIFTSAGNKQFVVGEQNSGASSLTISPLARTTLKAQLFENNLTITPATTLGSLTPASYPGYADVSIGLFGSPRQETDGSYTSQAPIITFPSQSSASVTCNVFGVGIYDGATSTLLWAEMAPQVIPMAAVDAQIQYSPQVNMFGPSAPGSGTWIY
jgi:hypothetical protein